MSAEPIYGRLAPVYDIVYGVGLQHGRRIAADRLALQPGERVLEVGTGSGLSALLHPPHCRVTAIDLSPAMLHRARARLQRHRLSHIALCRMDACDLGFPADRFDAVYAPYLVNVVPDASRAIRELWRVCKPGGRVVLLNHFAEPRPRVSMRLIGRIAEALTGAGWQLRLEAVLTGVGLSVVSRDDVNFGVSSVVLCRKT